MSKSSALKSPLRPSAATVSVTDTSQETESEMEISMASDATHQLSNTKTSCRPAAVTTTTAEDRFLDQFQQMRLVMSNFLGARQVQDSHSATIPTLRLYTWRNETF